MNWTKLTLHSFSYDENMQRVGPPNGLVCLRDIGDSIDGAFQLKYGRLTSTFWNCIFLTLTINISTLLCRQWTNRRNIHFQRRYIFFIRPINHVNKAQRTSIFDRPLGSLGCVGETITVSTNFKDERNWLYFFRLSISE